MKGINGNDGFALLSCDLEQQAIADRYDMQLHQRAHRVSVVAEPYHVSLAANKRRKRNIDDIHDWNKVLKESEDWSIQKKKDLAVDLKLPLYACLYWPDGFTSTSYQDYNSKSVISHGYVSGFR